MPANDLLISFAKHVIHNKSIIPIPANSMRKWLQQPVIDARGQSVNGPIAPRCSERTAPRFCGRIVVRMAHAAHESASLVWRYFFKYYFSIKMLHYVQIELLMASLTDADGMREWKGIILLKYYSIILRKTGALVSLLGFGILPGPDNDRSPSKLPATTR